MSPRRKAIAAVVTAAVVAAVLVTTVRQSASADPVGRNELPVAAVNSLLQATAIGGTVQVDAAIGHVPGVLLAGGPLNSLAMIDVNGQFRTADIAGFADFAKVNGARIVSGDFNHDGMTDLAVLPPGSATPWTAIPVALANGDGSFRTLFPQLPDWVSQATVAGAEPLAGDFDGDGNTDIALVGGRGATSIPIAFAKGDGTFRSTRASVADFPAWATEAHANARTGDFNHDGKTDIALIGGVGWTAVRIAFSLGNGTFNVTSLPVPGGFTALASPPPNSDIEPDVLTGDFNGDGKTDIALTGQEGWATVPIAISKGDGSFAVVNNPTGYFAVWAAQRGARPLTGDFNFDGKADIALVGAPGWTSVPMALSTAGQGFNVTLGSAPDFAAAAAVSGVTAIAANGTIVLVGGTGWTTLPRAYSLGDGSFDVRNLPAATFAGLAQKSTPSLAPGVSRALPLANPPTVANGHVVLSWKDRSSDEESFTIEKAVKSTDPLGPGYVFNPVGEIGTGHKESAGDVLTDIEPVSAGPQCYAVTAHDAGRTWRRRSNAGCVGDTTLGVWQGAPQLNRPEIFGSQVKLTWTDRSSSELKFLVGRRSAGGTWQTIGEVESEHQIEAGTVLTFVDTAPFANLTTECYVISAYKGGTTFPASPSNEQCGVGVDYLGVANAAPDLFTPTVSGGKVTLSWVDKSSNEDAFTVRKYDASGGSTIVSASSTATRERLGSGDTYRWVDGSPLLTGDRCYSVRAQTSAGTLVGESEKVCLPAGQSHAAPMAFRPLLRDGQVTVSWTDKASDENSFRIRKYTAAGGSTFTADVVTNDKLGAGEKYTWTDTAPISGGPQCYGVLALDTAGTWSAESEKQCVSPSGGVYSFDRLGASQAPKPIDELADNVVQIVNSKNHVVTDVVQTGSGFENIADDSVQVQAIWAPSGDIHFALMRDGAVKSWAGSAAPVTMPGLDDIVQIAAGNGFGLALKSGGSVMAWGINDQGQLGTDPGVHLRTVPQEVPGLGDVVRVEAGDGYGLALRSNGTVWAWGTGLTGAVAAPKQVPRLAGITQIAAGYHHALALGADGAVWAWGLNANGQAGIQFGTGHYQQYPMRITGLPSSVSSIAAGFHESLAVAGTDQSLWRWGGTGFFQGRADGDDDPVDSEGPTSSGSKYGEGPIGTYWTYTYDSEDSDFTLPPAAGRARNLFPAELHDIVQLSADYGEAGLVLSGGTVWDWQAHQSNPVKESPVGGSRLGIAVGPALGKSYVVGSPHAVLPSVRGMTATSARTVLENAGFVYGTVSNVPDNTCEFRGKVLSQTPGSGTRYPLGTRVELVFGTSDTPCR